MTRCPAALVLGIGISVVPLLTGQKPAARSGKTQQAPKSSPPGSATGHGNGERAVDRLSRMTPEERQKSLSSLPPARRQRIEQNLREFQTMPPAQQDRVRGRKELLDSLPPQRQNQVRRSVQQFLNMPEERQTVVNQEM